MRKQIPSIEALAGLTIEDAFDNDSSVILVLSDNYYLLLKSANYEDGGISEEKFEMGDIPHADALRLGLISQADVDAKNEANRQATKRRETEEMRRELQLLAYLKSKYPADA